MSLRGRMFLSPAASSPEQSTAAQQIFHISPGFKSFSIKRVIKDLFSLWLCEEMILFPSEKQDATFQIIYVIHIRSATCVTHIPV